MYEVTIVLLQGIYQLIMKIIIFLLFLSTGSILYSQNVENEEITEFAEIGTFQISVKVHQLKFDPPKLSKEQKIRIQQYRELDEEKKIDLDGYNITIMSKLDMDQGKRWSQYKTVSK